MRSILLLALLAGIYAHPLGGDHGMITSKEKRCLPNHCPLPRPLPYPPGRSARTCRDSTHGRNPWAKGLTVAPKKRSIFLTITTTPTNNHTERTDHLSLLQSRQPLCRQIAQIVHMTDLPGPTANSPEILLRAGATYFLDFTFDTIVNSSTVWVHHGGTRYSQLQVEVPQRLDGVIRLHELILDANVHLSFNFVYDRLYEATFGENPLNLHIHGAVGLF